MNILRIPVAKYSLDSNPNQLHDITPNEYKKKSNEFHNRIKLFCPDGHLIHFRNDSKCGRRAHFAHSKQQNLEECMYIKKYNTLHKNNGGESHEHLKAKLFFGIPENRVKLAFYSECIERNCINVIKKIYIDPEWEYETEYRLNMHEGSYIYADGVFLDELSQIRVVLEIKHSNSTSGKKLKWLQEQNTFDFLEIDAKIVNESKKRNMVFPIINQTDCLKYCETCNEKITQTVHNDYKLHVLNNKHNTIRNNKYNPSIYERNHEFESDMFTSFIINPIRESVTADIPTIPIIISKRDEQYDKKRREYLRTLGLRDYVSHEHLFHDHLIKMRIDRNRNTNY